MKNTNEKRTHVIACADAWFKDAGQITYTELLRKIETMTTPTTQREADDRAIYEAAEKASLKVFPHPNSPRLSVNMRVEMDRASYKAGYIEAARASLTPTAPAINPKAIEEIAEELHMEAARYEGDFADTVNGCADALLHIAQHGDTSTAPQAASQQAGEDVEDWRVGEFWSSANPGKKVLMLALGIDIENFGRHKDFIRWVAAPQAATTASTCACGHAVKDCDPRDKFKCEQLQATTASAAAEKCPKCGWRADSADCCGEEECGAAPVQAAQPALPADVSQVLRDVRFALVDVESEYRPEGTIAATINNAIASIDKVLPDDDASPGAAQTADARDEALEDAAKLCESEICACCWKDGAEDAALYLAEEIRALKSDRATHPTDKGQTNE